MAKKRYSTKRKSRSRQKQKKVSFFLVIGLALFLSAYLLISFNDKLKLDFIPTKEEFKQAVTGETPTATNNDCEVHFIDVGQGDCSLILSDGKVILIDAGENDQGVVVVDYIKKLGIKKIDLLMVTHPHSDHMGGMDAVIDTFEIGRIVMPKIPDAIVPTTRTYTDYLTSIANKGLKITPAKVGTSYEFGKGVFTILAPMGEFEDLNNTSLVTKFVYDGQNSVLFTGDMEKPAEKALLAEKNVDVKADVLKVAHHGSSTSTSKAFYEAVNPQYCAILVGDDNSYNHPNEKTLDQIAKNGAKIYRTDYQGSIVFGISNHEWNATFEKQVKD